MKRLSDRQQSQRPSSSPKVIEKFNSDPPSYGSEQTPKPHPPNSRGKALPQHSALQPSQNTPPNTHRGLLPSPPAHPSKIINITTLPTQYGAPPRSQDAPPAPQWYDPHGATRAALGTAPSPAAPHLPKHAGRTAPTAPNRYSPLHMVRRVPHPHPDGLALAHPAGAPFPSRWFSPQFLSGSVPALRCAPPRRRLSGTASRPRPRPLWGSPTAPAQPPPLCPGRGGSRTAVPARRALVVRPSAARRGVRTQPSRGEALGDTRWRTHLSPAAAQPLRRGPTPAHRHAALGPAPCVSWRQQMQRQRQRLLRARPNGSRGAAPPRPLPPAPAYRPLPPSGRKYRLLPPQTGTDVKERERNSESVRAQAQGRARG